MIGFAVCDAHHIHSCTLGKRIASSDPRPGISAESCDISTQLPVISTEPCVISIDPCVMSTEPCVISTSGRNPVPHNTAATSSSQFIPTREGREEPIATNRSLTACEMREHGDLDCGEMTRTFRLSAGGLAESDHVCPQGDMDSSVPAVSLGTAATVCCPLRLSWV